MTTLQLILITLSLHSDDNELFNNENYGAAVEYTDNFTYGIGAYQNSYDKLSVMASVSKHWGYYGLGVIAANGYEDNPKAVSGEYTIYPKNSLTYKNIRVETSWPFGKLTDNYDVINLQFTYDLEF